MSEQKSHQLQIMATISTTINLSVDNKLTLDEIRGIAMKRFIARHTPTWSNDQTKVLNAAIVSVEEITKKSLVDNGSVREHFKEFGEELDNYSDSYNDIDFDNYGQPLPEGEV